MKRRRVKFAQIVALSVGYKPLAYTGSLKMANAQHEIVAKIARLARRVVAPNCARESRADF